MKLPDRMVKRATVINAYDESQRRVQVSEFFNGAEGKRIVDYFDSRDNKVKSEVNIIEAQQMEWARFEQVVAVGQRFRQLHRPGGPRA